VELVLSIAAALAATDVPDRPTGKVKFFFGDQATPAIATKLETYAATPKTGAMGKSDQRACHEALLWTLLALERRAQQKGADAVVNIVSFYRKREMSSATEFECRVGNVIVSVFLKGDLVKLAEP
ncbi:MAG TPA: excinuclease ATPase subunit, partial [Candidatus Binatia bacterium]|nr:excinuclease ATPase subunit [Candidatus Binatia bacterium]